MCEAVAVCAVKKEHSGTEGGVYSWLGQVVRVLADVPHLIAPLVVRLWDLLSNKVGGVLCTMGSGHMSVM